MEIYDFKIFLGEPVKEAITLSSVDISRSHRLFTLENQMIF
ncbi:hypothetical protein B807_1011 [Fructilactobacillus florum 2F]|nr:hypothetical protein B807_1011 [Fructilactobacillus florum 2F]